MENIRKICINRAYEYLRSIGKVHTQTDIALKMKASRSNVSAALNGDAKFLTDKFLERFNEAFDGIFSIMWLKAGDGEMLNQSTININSGDNSQNVLGNGNNVNSASTIDKALNEIAEQRKLVSKAQEQLSKSQDQIDKLLAVIDKMSNVLK